MDDERSFITSANFTDRGPSLWDRHGKITRRLVSDPHRYFSLSYEEARRRFLAAAEGHPHFVERGQLDIDAKHSIDWAMTGDSSEKDLLVYTSGLHGIEGYTGSAVQLKLLELAEGRPTLWLHALNPIGMATFRRVNENNVDLNRNFMPDGASYAADDAAYSALDDLLNPKRAPGTDLFLIEAAVHLARRGMSSLRNAVARGQYSFPQGIFFGGSERQVTTREVLTFLPARLHDKRRVVHLDTLVFVQRDADAVAVPAEGLVDRVVDDLPQAVHEAPAIIGADVHSGALAHRLEAFQDGKILRRVPVGRILHRARQRDCAVRLRRGCRHVVNLPTGPDTVPPPASVSGGV